MSRIPVRDTVRYLWPRKIIRGWGQRHNREGSGNGLKITWLIGFLDIVISKNVCVSKISTFVFGFASASASMGDSCWRV